QLFKPHWQQYFFARNYMLVFLKNYETKNLLKHFPYAFYRYIIKGLILSLKSMDLKFVYIYLRVMIYIVFKAPSWLKKRIEIQAKRVVSDEKIWTDTKVEEFNPFNFKGRFVYSLLNLRASLDENISYDVNGKKYELK
ncbi:hypothetical protein KKB18_13890, partial [bacterium]|nr:hypothetical protein [bacterium]